MILGDRLEERMKAVGHNRTSLASRVGVKQPTITRLISGSQYSSTKLHVIARELRTTPAYLTGETDDPQADAPDAPELTHEHRQLLECYDQLDRADRAALLRIAHTMAGRDFVASAVHAPKQPFRGEAQSK